MCYLDKKRAMVVGLGSIGGEIAKKLHYGFNMKVIGVKWNPEFIPEDLKGVVC